MKKALQSLLLLLVIISFNSCRKALKDVNDYYPKVKIFSSTKQADGSVIVKGEIESEGESKIEHFGFCMGFHKIPEIRDNQISLSLNDKFTTAVGPFNIDSIYYVRAWATNASGYSYSNIIALDSVCADSVTPPCTLSSNYVKIRSGQPSYTYNSVVMNVNDVDRFDFTADSKGGTVYFYFGSGITTGIYTTTHYVPILKRQVLVHITSGGMSENLDSGSSVYVNVLGHNVYDISICDAPWQNSGFAFLFNSRCTVSY